MCLKSNLAISWRLVGEFGDYLVIKSRAYNEKEYQRLNDCSRNTATNDLRELVNKGVLKESGKKGAGAYYVIAQ